MPSWKKIITSGSNASLNSLYAPSITGSLLGTASYAIYAETASFSLATTENRILVMNKSGATITKGMVVHLTGSNNSSDTPYVITASYESDSLSANTLGIAYQTITTNNTGYVVTEGVLTGITVTGFVSGQILYLGATGSIIGTAPSAPLHSVRLGQVVRDSPSNNGSIYVRIDNGYEIGELHDVHDTTTSASYGDLLIKSASLWTNSKQLSGSYAITGSLTISGSSTFTNIGPAIFSGSVTSTGGFTGSLQGTAATASYVQTAQTASYVLQAVSASFASTASRVNTLNQNVVITGSLTVGRGTEGSTENTLILGPSPAGGVGEGGQLLLQAPGGTYTSASMWDNYQNQTRLLRGTNLSSDAVVVGWNMHSKQMQLSAYTSTAAFPGTAAATLAVDSTGNVITITGGGSTFPYTGSAIISGSLESTGSFRIQGAGNGFTGPFTAIEVDDVNFSRKLFDFDTGSGSLDFGARQLIDRYGTTAVEWTGTSGTYLSNLYGAHRIGSGVRDKLYTSNDYSGQILLDVYFDINVQENDLVYLGNTGEWLQVEQNNSAATKMLGIAKEIFNQTGSVLIEGDIVVTTVSGYPIVSNAGYGMPVYIKEGTGTQMDTTVPVNGYVRLLGYCYASYNASNDWIMKFRPSNEWVQL